VTNYQSQRPIEILNKYNRLPTKQEASIPKWDWTFSRDGGMWGAPPVKLLHDKKKKKFKDK